MTAAIGQHAAGRGDRVRSQVRGKIAEVDTKLKQLAAIRDQLARLADCRCEDDCPVIRQVLSGCRPRTGR
jgi:hypothetical protein